MNLSNDLRRGRSCVFLRHVHLVFVTKYRRDVFTKPILEALQKIFQNVCKDFAAELTEFEGERDHVHLLVNYPPKISVSKLVNSLKGVSSRLVRKTGYPTIQQALWGDSLWSTMATLRRQAEQEIARVQKRSRAIEHHCLTGDRAILQNYKADWEKIRAGLTLAH